MTRPIRMMPATKRILASLSLMVCAACASSPPLSEEEVQHTDSTKVDATIYAHREGLIACYDESPKRRTGRVSVRFRIEPNGKVSQAGVDMSTLSDRPVEKCLVEVINGINFPVSSPGAVDYQYPFKFMKGKAVLSPNPR